MNTIIEKPWGQEEILETNPNYTVKRLTMNVGCKCSLQYHEKKKETIYVLYGVLTLYLGSTGKKSSNLVTHYIKQGEYVSIEPTTVHRMEAQNVPVTYLECSTSQLDDVIRIEDDYGRK
jgi:mannose-6-phosphate isomerase-like protein (cupin superfamily)